MSREEEVIEDYGFIDGRPVHIDVARMVRDDSMKEPLNVLREVFRMSKKIEKWLVETHPSLVPEFQNEVQDLLAILEEG